MLLGELVELAKIRLKTFAQGGKDNVLMSIANLGITDLYRRFNLKLKSETITINSDRSLYELTNDDVLLLLALYNVKGYELRQGDVLDGLAYEYKIVNYKSFILHHAFNGYLYAVYKAAPVYLSDANDEVELPAAMNAAVVYYICGYIESSIYSKGYQNKQDADYYMKLYENECVNLTNQGYVVPLNTETLSIKAKGYV